MESKTFLLFCVIISCLFATNASPRDSSIVKQDAVSEAEDFKTKAGNESPIVTIKKDYQIPGRIVCQYEEPTEDVVCQEHCLPKGYSFGICVSNTCSCV